MSREKWVWPALAAVVALLAIPGVFTLSKVFYARDLATTFLPHHLWFRDTIFAGQLPLWNPYPGFGYSTVSDPSLQSFFLPILPLRLLPAFLGFNLIVALPFAVAAVGMYRLLGRRLSPQASCLGAVVFAASGPILSTANMPNLSWSCACIPWVLGSVDALVERRSLRRMATLASATGLMILAGEPVTFAATAVLAVAYAIVFSLEHRTLIVGATGAALGTGALLAAGQLLPAFAITSGSIRASGALSDIWALHPARLVETVAPFVYGKYTGLPHEITQWLFVFNDKRDPFLFSLYLGVPALLLAATGAARFGRDRNASFWCVVGVLGLVAAMGFVPSFGLLRFPSKYLALSALSLAGLAAIGWDGLAAGSDGFRRRMRLPLGIGTILVTAALAALLLTAVFPNVGVAITARLAKMAALPSPDTGALSLVQRVGAAAPRLLCVALFAAIGLEVAASRRRAAGIARVGMFVFVVADLVVANASINPTMAIDALAPSAWVGRTRAQPADRVYVARDFVDKRAGLDDAPPPPRFPPDRKVVAYQAVFETALGSGLSATAVPLTLARELSGLRPREYLTLLRSFSEADRAARYRFLSWAGTRYYLVTLPPPLPSTRLVDLPIGSLALYESVPAGSRAFMASSAVSESDGDAAIRRLFDPGFDLSSVVMLERVPADSHSAGMVDPQPVSIREERATSVVVDASAPDGGGFLVLLDSFDRGWRAAMDDRDVPILRANGVFRAVAMPAGRHEVRFRYAPRPMFAGMAISLVAMLVVGGAALRRASSP